MRRADRIEVFKKNVLKRLYPASESDDSVSTDNESAQSHEPALKSAHSSRPRLYTAASAPTVDEDEDHVISNVAADKQHPTSEDPSTLTKAISSKLHASRAPNAVATKMDTNLSKEADRPTLTKNQKRKLKKKRRKEKLKQIDDTGREFIFHSNSEKGDAESESAWTESFAYKKRNDVIEFFESIWEIYNRQCILQNKDVDNTEKRSQVSLLLGSLSNADSDNDDLKLLAEVKSILLSKDQQMFMHLKPKLQSEFSLGKDIGNLVIMLCECWIYDIS